MDNLFRTAQEWRERLAGEREVWVRMRWAALAELEAGADVARVVALTQESPETVRSWQSTARATATAAQALNALADPPDSTGRAWFLATWSHGTNAKQAQELAKTWSRLPEATHDQASAAKSASDAYQSVRSDQPGLAGSALDQAAAVWALTYLVPHRADCRGLQNLEGRWRAAQLLGDAIGSPATMLAAIAAVKARV